VAAVTPLAWGEKLLWRAAEQVALAAARAEGLLLRPSPRGPIDAVYTWAGPDTPERRAERAHHAARADAPASEGPWRWADHGELRFALRALHRFAPFVRRVHVVVAAEPPPWLNLEHPGLQVVTHAQIFPDPSHLPTFSSCAIECHLHRIPDLAERFWYFNDDMILGRPLAPAELVDRVGRLRLQLQWKAGRFEGGPPRPDDPPHVRRARNTARLLHARFGPALRLWPIHQGRMASRAVYGEMHAEPLFRDALRFTSAQRFRHPDAIDPIYLQFFVALHTGRARLTARPAEVLFIGDDPARNRRRYRRVLARRPHQLCLQDDLHAPTPEVLADLRAFLEALEPTPSPYERAAPLRRAPA